MSLENAKIGDTVIVSRGGFNGYEKVAKVIAITPKGFVKVGDALYDPCSGRMRGNDAWHSQYAHLATPEEIQRVLDKNELASLQYKLSQLNNLPLEKLRRIFVIIREESKP